jgi:hypothetical protein
VPSKLLSLEERQKIIKGLLAERKARERQQHPQQQPAAAAQGWASDASDGQQRVQQMLGERQLARGSSGAPPPRCRAAPWAARGAEMPPPCPRPPVQQPTRSGCTLPRAQARTSC